MRRLAGLAMAAALAAVATAPAFAQEHRGGEWHGGGRGEWHDGRGDWRGDGPWRGDIRRFHERDFALWRGGRWFNGPHLGRNGWWWIVGGSWYFYPAPIYPYPDPYIPPVVAAPPPVQGQPPAQYWYYCQNPQGYYPYINQCSTNWQPVPASPG